MNLNSKIQLITEALISLFLIFNEILITRATTILRPTRGGSIIKVNSIYLEIAWGTSSKISRPSQPSAR